MSRYAVGCMAGTAPPLVRLATGSRSWPAVGTSPPVYLHPGQMHVAQGPCVVSTILGSCVSVCLFDPARGVGGVNHFLLPHDGGAAAVAGRYGPAATAELTARVVAAGASRHALLARIVGGANVLAAFQRKTNHLGAANVDAARRSLAEMGIPVVDEDVGGAAGRKLLFSVADGATWTQLIRGGR